MCEAQKNAHPSERPKLEPVNQSTDNNYKESSKDQKAKSLFLRPKHAAVILCAVPSRYSRIEMDAREFEDCQPEFGLNEARRVVASLSLTSVIMGEYIVIMRVRKG